MKIGGINKLKQRMESLQRAMEEIDGNICTVSLDPYDPQSIEVAIAQMEASLDARIGGSSDEIVLSLVGQAKEKFREKILHQALMARGEAENE